VTCGSANGQCIPLNILKVLQDLFLEVIRACISNYKNVDVFFAFTCSLTFLISAVSQPRLRI